MTITASAGAIALLFACSTSARNTHAPNQPSWKDQSVQNAMDKYQGAHPDVHVMDHTVTPPRLIKQVHPVFPASALRKERTLSPIIVEVVLTEAGEVRDPSVLRSQGPDLDQAVADAVTQWKYEPAQAKGKVLSVFIVVSVEFERRE